MIYLYSFEWLKWKTIPQKRQNIKEKITNYLEGKMDEIQNVINRNQLIRVEGIIQNWDWGLSRLKEQKCSDWNSLLSC